MGRPDLAFEGLKRVLNADTTLSQRFFRNIALGEASQELESSSCAVTLPSCVASTYASPIKMLTYSGLGDGVADGALSVSCGAAFLPIAAAAAVSTMPL